MFFENLLDKNQDAFLILSVLKQKNVEVTTGGYFFENLTGWLLAFDASVMVRSIIMITEDIGIKIKAL